MPRALLLAVLAVLVTAAPARAKTATLWGCHGPAGEPLPLGFTASETAETAVTAADGGCAARGGTLRIGFTRADPLAGQWAALRFAAPALEHVALGRRAAGPGYWARTATGPLEALPGPGALDGVLSAAAGGTWVELGLRCETAAERCSAPDAAAELSFAALTVRDATAPTLVSADVPSYASGTLELVVDASDAGIGLAAVSASLAGGQAVASERLGPSLCRELSPADATVDLPLAEDCPANDRVVLELDTTAVADGTHPLAVAVTDGAGNVTTRELSLRVLNHPPGPSPVPPAPRGVATAPPPRPIALPAVLRAAGRYRVSRTGTITVETSCPRAATVRCKLALTLKARLPGRTRAATIATARATAKPGRRVFVKLRLSRAALRAKGALRAQLTLEGAEPVRVRLER